LQDPYGHKDAFGEDSPSQASIAIMNDSDNTGEGSVSYIDYIEIHKWKRGQIYFP